MPRAFSITHVNLTHRNWTAFGLPGRVALPIMDPRGLLTPFWDSWSIDVWCVDDCGDVLLPSRATDAEQWQLIGDSLSVKTCVISGSIRLQTQGIVVCAENTDRIRLSATAQSESAGWLVISLRSCSPEGVSFIDNVVLDRQARTWTVNEYDTIAFDQAVDEHHASGYQNADVYVQLRNRLEADSCL